MEEFIFISPHLYCEGNEINSSISSQLMGGKWKSLISFPPTSCRGNGELIFISSHLYCEEMKSKSSFPLLEVGGNESKLVTQGDECQKVWQHFLAQSNFDICLLFLEAELGLERRYISNNLTIWIWRHQRAEIESRLWLAEIGGRLAVAQIWPRGLSHTTDPLLIGGSHSKLVKGPALFAQ